MIQIQDLFENGKPNIVLKTFNGFIIKELLLSFYFRKQFKIRKYCSRHKILVIVSNIDFYSRVDMGRDPKNLVFQFVPISKPQCNKWTKCQVKNVILFFFPGIRDTTGKSVVYYYYRVSSEMGKLLRERTNFTFFAFRSYKKAKNKRKRHKNFSQNFAFFVLRKFCIFFHKILHRFRSLSQHSFSRKYLQNTKEIFVFVRQKP